jgi:hypothetical protein
LANVTDFPTLLYSTTFASGLIDFEDAVQIYSAIAQDLDVIVTLDNKGFLSSTIQVFSVRQLLNQLQSTEN